jgi:Xaa-Pro aminopeptidase
VRDEYQLPSKEFRLRRERFAKIFAKHGFDGCICYADSLNNGYVAYFSGYNCVITWSNVMLALDRDGTAHLFAAVPGRDMERLKAVLPKDVEITLVGLSLVANDHIGDKVAEQLNALGLSSKKWGGVNLESAPWAVKSALVSTLGDIPDLTSAFKEMRSIKMPREISVIGQATSLARWGCIELARECLPCNTEAKAAADIDRRIRYFGAEDVRIMIGTASTGGRLRFSSTALFVEDDIVKIFMQIQYLGYKAEYGLTVTVCPETACMRYDERLEAAYLDFEQIKKAITNGRDPWSIIRREAGTFSSVQHIGMDLDENPGVMAASGKNHVVSILLDQVSSPVLIADTFVTSQEGLMSLSGPEHSMGL